MMTMTMMPRRPFLQLSLLTATIALAAASSLDAQRGGAAAPATAGPATVEFIATTADGQMVTDLTAAQVTLRVNNRDRAISSLELVRFGAGAAPASALPAPFGTNSRAEAGRSIMVVVDEESIRPGRETGVKDALTEFEKGLSANDRLSLFTIPRGSISLPPTTDREAFRANLAKVQGRGRVMTAAERRCHARDTVTAFDSLLTAAVPAGGGVTPVLFFTTGLTGAAAGTAALDSADDCIVQPSVYQRMGPAADQANAQLYLIRADDNPERTTLEGLENLVGVTGGQMFHLAGADGGAMTRIARETAAYYVATFAAEGSERTGASARVELRSSRADVTIRTRTSVVIPRGSSGAITPESMLLELGVHRGFGLRVVGIPSRLEADEKNDMKVFALAETVDPSVKLKSAAAALYDPLNKRVAQWTARPEELQRRILAAAIPVPAGEYRLRVAAVDTNGRAATADYELTVGTASAGPAKLGGLMMGVAGTGGFEPIITITDQKEIIAVFELYGRPAGPFGALVEVLPSLTDKALVSAPPQPSATAVADKFMFMAKIPVGDLKPGDYILRAQLAFQDQPTGTLTKTIRKQ
jgi:hypothetical protein